jgi:ABC-type antimicrobial peptide transport system permease subunit
VATAGFGRAAIFVFFCFFGSVRLALFDRILNPTERKNDYLVRLVFPDSWLQTGEISARKKSI